MLCSRCMQREANVFFTRNINGKKEEYKVCDVCAKEMGLLSQAGVMFDMGDFISDFVGKGIHAVNSGATCPVCHTSIEQFAKTSKFGCGSCYEAFERYLDPVMRRIHGTTMHTGKIPDRSQNSALKKRRLTDLKEQINRAIACEDFESAAKLRDEIKALTDEIKKEGE